MTAFILMSGLASCTGTTPLIPTWHDLLKQPDEGSGLKLYHEEYGSGKPLLFIHGFGASTYSWRFLAPALSKSYRLLLVDLKGFGRSPKPAEHSYAVYDQAHLIYQFIKEENLKDLTIIGHFFGGAVALAASLYLKEKDPSLLKRLILINSAAYEQKPPYFIKLLIIPILGKLFLYLIPARYQVASVLKLAYYDDEKIVETAIREHARPVSMPGGRYALFQTAKQLDTSDRLDLTAKYKEINILTLIIWGKEDEVIPLGIEESACKEKFTIPG